MMLLKRKLGKRQKIMLKAINDFGPWHRGCHWSVEIYTESKKICESLVRRGLLYRDHEKNRHVAGNGPSYMLTDKGRAMVENTREL